ncbi:MAG: penicillin-binding protein 2 [Bacillota bacterium]
MMLHRVRLIFVLVIGIFILLSGRLAYLQILQHDYYLYRSESNRFTKITLVAPRGEIYDRQGELLVTNRPGFIVSLMDMGDGYDDETIAFLSEILGIPEAEIRSAIDGQLYMRYLPLRLKSDITPEIIARISENRWKLKGVNIEVHPIRDYRVGSTAAHIFGYLGQAPVGEYTQALWSKAGYEYAAGDLVGQEGIERAWEPWLRGRNGEQRIETNNLGQLINYFERKDPVPGNNLYLTLDLELQRVTEDILKRRVETILADGKNKYAGRATAVVLDPNSGAILALANYPSYNLNTVRQDYEQLAADPLRPLNNLALQGTFPIGSTFKMVTGTAVIEEGKLGPRDIAYCPGVITLVGDTKSCYNKAAHGAVNFYDAMAVSCNIYFYRAGLAVGIDKLAEYAREYGFGSPTGLTDVPGESAGVVASREYKASVSGGEQWYAAETMSAAIGQSYNSFTTLQLANYAAIIANGGTHYRPYLVQTVLDSAGRVVRETVPEPLRQAQISERTLSIVREGMRRVTQPRGTAWYRFSHLPVAVAGKTGSSEVGDSNKPSHSLFTGYAPYEKPEIVVAVVVEFGGLGETGAVPIAAEIMEYYFTGTIKGVMDSDADDGPPAD